MSYELFHIKKRDKENMVDQKHFILKRMLDQTAYLVAIAVPMFSIDQALKIWIEKSADEVSLAVWLVLTLSAIFWIIYSLVHKEWAIFTGHIAWFILSLTIVIEILIFS